MLQLVEEAGRRIAARACQRLTTTRVSSSNLPVTLVSKPSPVSRRCHVAALPLVEADLVLADLARILVKVAGSIRASGCGSRSRDRFQARRSAPAPAI